MGRKGNIRGCTLYAGDVAVLHSTQERKDAHIVVSEHRRSLEREELKQVRYNNTFIIYEVWNAKGCQLVMYLWA
jgi:hypothetical protein